MDKKQIVKEMLQKNEEELVRLEVMEKYLMSREAVNKLSGRNQVQMALGATQRQMRDLEDFIKFLKNYGS